MRILALAILVTVAGLISAPAHAQKYGGNAQVCLHKYYWNGGDSYDCSYTTMAQCAATASSLPATCDTILCERASTQGTGISAAASRPLSQTH
jgi:hypothetical protein